MKTNSSFLIPLACVMVFSACAPRAIEYRTYDLDAVRTERNLKMSDLADNLRVVPLESDKDFIVSSESKNWVNDKYIIIFGKNTIEQFSSVDGTHIRTLARMGDGPDEFDFCISPIVDDAKQILYITKTLGDITKGIDLNTGVFLPDNEVDNKTGIVPEEQLLLEKTLFDNLDTKTNDDFFNNETDKDISYVSSIGSNLFLQRQELRLLKYTLYSIIGDIPTPYCSFVFKDETGKSNLGIEGTSLDIEYVDSKSIVASLVETRMEMKRNCNKKDERNSIGIRKHEKRRMIIDRESTEIAKLGKFIINPFFEYEGAFHSPCFFRGKTLIAYPIESFALRDCMEDALTSESLSGSTRLQMESLNNQLSENSNPVFVIGTKK